MVFYMHGVIIKLYKRVFDMIIKGSTGKNSHLKVVFQKDVFKNFPKFLGKHLWCRPTDCNFIQKATLTQVFSCKFCWNFKDTFFIEHIRWLLLHKKVEEDRALRTNNWEYMKPLLKHFPENKIESVKKLFLSLYVTKKTLIK